MPGSVTQPLTCLTAATCLTADPRVASSIPAWLYTFAEIDHEMNSTAILLFPSVDSRRAVVSYKRKYVHEVLVNRLVKLRQVFSKPCLVKLISNDTHLVFSI